VFESRENVILNNFILELVKNWNKFCGELPCNVCWKIALLSVVSCRCLAISFSRGTNRAWHKVGTEVITHAAACYAKLQSGNYFNNT
jgi:hypothetical protein